MLFLLNMKFSVTTLWNTPFQCYQFLQCVWWSTWYVYSCLAGAKIECDVLVDCCREYPLVLRLILFFWLKCSGPNLRRWTGGTRGRQSLGRFPAGWPVAIWGWPQYITDMGADHCWPVWGLLDKAAGHEGQWGSTWPTWSLHRGLGSKATRPNGDRLIGDFSNLLWWPVLTWPSRVEEVSNDRSPIAAWKKYVYIMLELYLHQTATDFTLYG